MKRAALGPALAACAVASLGYTADYYVDSSVSVTGDGSEQAPFRTIQECATLAVAGDRCLLREGIYYESSITPAHDGQPGALISFEAYAGERAVLDGEGAHERAFDIAGQDHIRISGLELQHYHGRPIVYYASADYGIVEHNVIHDVTENSGHLKGIQLQDTEGALVQHNTIFDLSGHNEAFGIFTDGRQRDTTIRGNLLYFIDKSGIRVTCEAATSTNVVVENNIAIHIPYAGIEVNSCWPTGGVVVRNNFVGFNGAAGFHPKHTDHVTIQNNTIVLNQQFGLWCAGGTGVSANDHQVLKNNIIYNNAEGTYLDQGNYDLNPLLDYSLYLNEGHTDIIVDIHGIQQYATLAEVTANTPFEDHGLLDDPLFVAPAAGDFTLQAGSAAVSSADDGSDRGAASSELQGTGADGASGLSVIPQLGELALTVADVSSETPNGAAAHLVDASRSTLWVPATTGPEWVDLDLPGDTPLELSRFALIRANHEAAENPRQFRLYTQADGSAAWSEVDDSADAYEAYVGAAGRLWKLPQGTSAVAVRLELLNNHGGAQLELAGFRLYGMAAGTGGSAGAGGSGGAGGAGADAGTGGSGAAVPGTPPGETDDDGGCGCRAAGSEPRGLGWLVFGLATAGLRRRREGIGRRAA